MVSRQQHAPLVMNRSRRWVQFSRRHLSALDISGRLCSRYQNAVSNCEGRRRMRRFMISLATIIATVFGVFSFGGAQTAFAAAPNVCMFNAPSGAQLLPLVGAGHVGWGFLSSGSTWIFGATEGSAQV